MVSIIIPVYNAERTIKRCVESLRKQKLDSKEFIFVNDGSKDSSLEILRHLAESIQDVKIIDKQNGGVSSARNAGLKIANGEFITFMDADDYYLDNSYISNMVKTMTETEADMVVSGLTVIKENGMYEVQVENRVEKIDEFVNHFFQYSNLGIFNSPWNKLFRKEKIKHTFCEDMNFGEDTVFVAGYLMNCQIIAFCSGCGYGYEVLEKSTTADYRKNLRYDMVQTNKYYTALAGMWFRYLEFNTALDNYMRLKAQGVYTILLRILKKDGIIQFIQKDIDEILSDAILKKNGEAIHASKSSSFSVKASKYIVNGEKIKLKMLVFFYFILHRKMLDR